MQKVKIRMWTDDLNRIYAACVRDVAGRFNVQLPPWSGLQGETLWREVRNMFAASPGVPKKYEEITAAAMRAHYTPTVMESPAMQPSDPSIEDRLANIEIMLQRLLQIWDGE